jgi:hypothetical protein
MMRKIMTATLFVALFGLINGRAEDKAAAGNQSQPSSSSEKTAKKQPPKPDGQVKIPSVRGAGQTVGGNPGRYGGRDRSFSGGTTSTNPNQGSSVGNTGSGR